jgi:thioesterase DpgC
MERLHQDQVQLLLGVGVFATHLKNFQKALQALRLPRRPTRDQLKSDSAKLREICRVGARVLKIWPPRPQRDSAQNGAAELVKGVLRDARNVFAHTFVDLIFNRITDGYRRFIRAEDLVYEGAELCPGLCPTRKEVESDSPFSLAEKEGVEIAQSDFLAHVFARRTAGLFLIHSMLQPLRQSQELLEKIPHGRAFGPGNGQVERHGPMGCIFFNNCRRLNAEDDPTVLPLEIAADLVLLDSEVEVGLLRGNPMNHPK